MHERIQAVNGVSLLNIINIQKYRPMSRTITFNELRRIKNRLPEGSIHVIAEKLNLPDQSVRNYFGGTDYDSGTNMGFHLEPGPDGGLVVLDDTQILDMALEILEKKE